MTIEEFYVGVTKGLVPVGEFAVRHSLGTAARADHVCYKCGSEEEFESMRRTLEAESEYVHQAIISGRRIAYIKLHTPIATPLGEVWFVELSDQKPDNSQTSGFDYIEIYPLEMAFDALAVMLEQGGERVEKIVRPHHTTYDIALSTGFLVRLEPEPLIEKIKREEM